MTAPPPTRSPASADVVYSAAPELRALGRFLDGARADLGVAPSVAWQLFLRRTQAAYRRSWLGYLWLLLPPLATTAAWLFLAAARVIAVRDVAMPYPVYVLSGILLWQLFAEALLAPLQQLSASRAILARSRMPLEALLLAGVFEVLFNFAVRLAVLLPLLVWGLDGWHATAPLALVGVLALLLLGLAIGLLATPVGLLYQDVQRALTLAVAVWFVVTPVTYAPPTAGLPSVVQALNPVATLLAGTRAWLTGDAGAAGAAPLHFAAVLAASLVAVVAGWLACRLARPHLVARL